MAMQVEYEGEKYVFDMEQDVTTDQLIKIKKVYGLNLLTLAQGMRDGDIEALLCVWWLIQASNGKDLLRLETVKIDNPVTFAGAIMTGILKEQLEFVEKAEAALAAGEKSPKA
jgi:hypothetical protein